MRLWAGAAGFLALVAGGAVAEPSQVETRFGPISIVSENVDEVVLFGGVAARGPEGTATDHRLTFNGVWPIGHEDAVLISAWAGGNDVCASSYFIVVVSSAGARATAPFGRCTIELIEAHEDAGRLELHLRPSDPRLERVEVVFFNGQASESGTIQEEQMETLRAWRARPHEWTS